MEQAILTKDQKMVLDLVRRTPEISQNFYLTGGTALAEFYLQHRYSDDLDFFTENKEFPDFDVEKFAGDIKNEINALSVEYRRIHDRRIFFFKKSTDELKVEFTYYPFMRLVPAVEDGLAIDSLEDIAANKLMTLFDRIEAKDFVDVYFIIHEAHLSLEQILVLVERKFRFSFEPLTLGSTFTRVSAISDLPKMIKPLTVEGLKMFFAEEAKKLASEILKDRLIKVRI